MNQSDDSLSFYSNSQAIDDINSNVQFVNNQNEVSQILADDSDQSIHQQQNEIDQSQDQTTKLIQNDPIHRYTQHVLGLINTKFTQKLNTFIPKLFNDTSLKIFQYNAITQVLSKIRIKHKIITSIIEYKRSNEKRLKSDYFSSRRDIQQQQKRNTDNNTIEQLNKHLEGDNIKFYCHDANYNPIYLVHNQVLIYVESDKPEYKNYYLEVIEQFFIHPKVVNVDQRFTVRSNRSTQNQYDSLKINLVMGQNNDNERKNKKLMIDFIIKADNFDLDECYEEIIRTYTQINYEFKKVCAFLNYWAFQRGLLGDHALSEFALYCMIIDFYQTKSLLPNIFSKQFCLWSEKQKKLMKLITSPSDERLTQEFKPKDYFIYKAQDGSKSIMWRPYPKFEDFDQIMQVWKDVQLKENQNEEKPSTIGQQVAWFFYVWNQEWKYTQPLCFTAQAQQDQQQDKKEKEKKVQQEIGLVIYDPIIPETILTPLLKKRTKNAELISNNVYNQFRQEIRRANDLIEQGKLGDLCKEQDKFI